MAAYVIADIDVRDPERYAEYVKRVPASIEAYGGRYLVRAGRCEQLEGDRVPRRVIVLEFDSYERAREWWDSESYRALAGLRHAASKSEILLVEGYAP